MTTEAVVKYVHEVEILDDDGPLAGITGVFDESALPPETLERLDGYCERIAASKRDECLAVESIRRELKGTGQCWVKYLVDVKELYGSQSSVKRYARSGGLLWQYRDTPELGRVSVQVLHILAAAKADDEDIERVIAAVRGSAKSELRPKDLAHVLPAAPVALEDDDPPFELSSEPAAEPERSKIEPSTGKGTVKAREVPGDLPFSLKEFVDDGMWSMGPTVMADLKKWLERLNAEGVIGNVLKLAASCEKHEQLLREWVVTHGDAAMPAKLKRIAGMLEAMKAVMDADGDAVKEIDGLSEQFKSNAPVVCGSCKGRGCRKCANPNGNGTAGKGWLPKKRVKA